MRYKTWRKRSVLKNLIIQCLFFIAIFQLITWFKQSDMLPKSHSTAAEQFILPSLDGTNTPLRASKRNTIVYFFAPWCGICDLSMANLESVYKSHHNVDVIAVALDYTDKSEVLQFSEKHQFSFPVLYGNSQVKNAYKINAYPSYYVLDEESTIISKSMGYSTEIGLYLRSL